MRGLITSASIMAYMWNPFETEAPLSPFKDFAIFSEPYTMNQMGFDEVSEAFQSSERLKAIQADLEKSLLTEISDLLGQEEKTSPISSSSEPLNNLGTSDDCSNRETSSELINKEEDPIEARSELSTEEIVRVAGARFIQLADHTDGDPSMLNHPFGLLNSGLTAEEMKNIDLASLLLAAAEKVSSQQYDRARFLLGQCFKLSSIDGNPVERLVYYFSDALNERIDRDAGRMVSTRPREKSIPEKGFIEKMLTANPLQLVFHEKVPLSKVMQFTSIQAIIDNVALAKRIHVIDLSIRHGPQWTVLMQALAERVTCRIDYLKISAVGTSEEAITKTGKRLESFAETLGLSFDFKAIIVADMQDLKEEMFEVEEGEAVGVYSSLVMNSMVARPESLEILVKVLQSLNPCIMTIADVEAKHNSPSFINRFTESLFHYSAMFDCLDGCMDRSDANRSAIEGGFFSDGIKSIIATEGIERVVRHVGISMWRSFFARFGIVETELNEWSQFEATLLVKQFSHGSSCTLHKNGKSLLVGWKGTPLYFISAWKFQE